MIQQAIQERLSIITSIYQDFVGYGLNSHFPGPNTLGLFPEEIFRLIWCELENDNNNSAVLGSHNGGSELIIALTKRYKGDKSQIFSVDIKFGDFFELNRTRLKNKTGIELVKWEIDSKEFGQLYGAFTSDNLGLVLIDSLHKFSHIIGEFNGIKNLIVEDGIVLFHDCSPIYPKAGIPYSKEMFNTDYEDFFVDESISYIVDHNPEFKDYRIPICETMNRNQETQLDKWVRGKTSPNQALYAIQYNEQH